MENLKEEKKNEFGRLYRTLNIIGEIMKRLQLQWALSHAWRKKGASVLLMVQCSIPRGKIPSGRLRM